MRLRVTMAGMLGVVLFSGLVLAALRTGTDVWARAVYSVTLGTLLFGAVLARYRGPFWHGFAVVGIGYFLAGFGPWLAAPPGSEGRALNRNLATSLLVEAATEAILARDPAPPPVGAHDYYLMRAGRAGNLNAIGHSALTVVLATGAGVAARYAAARGRSFGRGPV